MNNKKNILITGSNGQLGSELRRLAGNYSAYDFYFTDKEDLSITDKNAVEKYFSEHHVTYCINCAAYTAVDKAETEKDPAFDINANGAAHLADACRKNDARLIHVSTDYVFNGNGSAPYKESDKTDPLGVYGASKLAGEHLVLEKNDRSLIIRTSWVYSSYGKNFVKTMLRLMNEKESISVVNDQFGCPTYAADLAETIMKIIRMDAIPGIYNYCNEGIISWYEFALAINEMSNSKCIVNPIKTIDYPTTAKRPQYSALDTTKIKETFRLAIPSWKDSLAKCIAVLKG